jgi:hypothetical protein
MIRDYSTDVPLTNIQVATEPFDALLLLKWQFDTP